jgi:hypothetical protein
MEIDPAEVDDWSTMSLTAVVDAADAGIPEAQAELDRRLAAGEATPPPATGARR